MLIEPMYHMYKNVTYSFSPSFLALMARSASSLTINNADDQSIAALRKSSDVRYSPKSDLSVICFGQHTPDTFVRMSAIRIRSRRAPYV
jgi:hypothetical protein